MTTPQRIASLLSSATEMLCGLGLIDRLVAVSHECDYPAEVTARPRVTHSRVDSGAGSRAIDEQVRSLMTAGETLYEVDVAKLEHSAPDLIVTQAQCDVCAVRYEDVIQAVASSPVLRGTPVLDLNPHSLADVLDDIQRVAEVTGTSAVGREYLGYLKARVENVRERTIVLPLDQRPRVACIEWTDPIFLTANWMPQLIGWAGGNDGGFGRQGEHSTVIPWEKIREFDPQVVLVMPCGFDLARTLVEARGLLSLQGWDESSAARAGRVYAVDGNAYFNRSGPRLVESLEIMAHLFHPEVHPVPVGVDPAVTWKLLD
jgi:iron complex transport system substrate-binding protein